MERLGDLQLKVMEEVWRLGQATVPQVHEALSARRRIAYTTVLTTMRALERRGMVAHEETGRAYLYRPLVTRQQYTRASVRRLVDNLFHGRQEYLLCHLLGAECAKPEQLKKIRRILSQAQGRRR